MQLKKPFNTSLAKPTELEPDQLPGPASYSQQFNTIENQLQQRMLRNFKNDNNNKTQQPK